MEYKEFFERARLGSRQLVMIKDEQIRQILETLADETRKSIPALLTANQLDLAKMPVDNPMYDRLLLTQERIEGIIQDLLNVGQLPSPLHRQLSAKKLANGLQIDKVTVPIGVVGIIYEARPNVTFDVFALCLKSGNACLLKGGSDAAASNQAILEVIHRTLEKCHISTDIVQLLPPDRAATSEMLQAIEYVDIIIPRGSQGLINFVRENAKVPVIETGAGIVHTYFDKGGDLEKGKAIIFNAKTRRPSVCNALDCLLIHENRLPDLPQLCESLAVKGVEVFADSLALEQLTGNYPADLLFNALPEHYGTEFFSLKLSIKTVGSLDEALDHIATYSSKHSEAITSEDLERIELFRKMVDASSVYSNTSTAYTDGAQFGLGAEIGISTQKLHARGPMALEELCSYKWIIEGNGQVRPK